MNLPQGYKPMDTSQLTDTRRLTAKEFIDWYNSSFGEKGGVYHLGVSLAHNENSSTRDLYSKLHYIRRVACRPVLHVQRVDHGEYRYIIRRSTFNPHARRVNDILADLRAHNQPAMKG